MLTKEDILQTFDKLPEEFTLDELIDHLMVIKKIERGLKASERGDVYTVDEAKEKLGKWLD